MAAEALLNRLEKYKTSFGKSEAAAVLALLNRAATTGLASPAQLVRLHEILLFLRAYPHSVAAAGRADAILAGLAKRVAGLRDTIPLEEPDVSGIAGTGITAVFSRDLARYLVRTHGGRVSIHWEAWENPQRLGLILPGLLPLADDDMAVEAHPPYREWLEAAGGLPWLAENADRWDELEIPLRWTFDDPVTRTCMRLPARPLFIHSGRLIARRDVSLEAAASEQPLPARRLPLNEGLRILDFARDTSAVRYRELHGFTNGDPVRIDEFQPGRGVRIYLWGVGPEHRLPLRAYHAATIWKNGVPIGYFEGLSIAERMEAGFNLYYTFREGETAWLYARLLKIFHDALGIRTVSLDTYQIGHENEEAITSGAFWFYRKLGFRSTDPELRKLTTAEERRIAARPGYRTSAATLRRLVRQPMVYEYPGAEPGAWDAFEARRIGIEAVRRVRGERVRHWDALKAAIPGFAKWSAEEKSAFEDVAAAKYAPEEADFLRLLRSHERLRRALIRLGSAGQKGSG